MTTSGSFTFDPTFAGLLDEAAERAGIDPATISHRHISSAKMSLNLMFTEWQARDGDVLYRISSTTQALSAGTSSFALTSGAFDIIDAVIDIDNAGSEISFRRVPRQEYLNIPDKTDTGDPTIFYVDHSSLNEPTVYVWPVPEAALTIRYDYIRFVETVGSLSETMDVQRPWLEAVAAGLAARLALKYNAQRYGILDQLAERAYAIARRAGSGNSHIIISGRGFGRSRTRRSVG